MTADDDLWRLDGRVAVVTGASRGIGRAIVQELARLGATVIGCARDTEGLASLGPLVVPVTADVTTTEGRAAVLDAVRSRAEALDVLVNNAGRNIRTPTLEMDDVDLRAVLELNLLSPWRLVLDAHPLLSAAARPSVVNIGSVASGLAVRQSTAAYAASKGGLDALTRFLAAEWGPQGIRVNTVAPWYVRTPLAEPVLADPAKREAILARTPLRRLGEPEDIARAVAFLAVPASGWITGCWLPVDGGFSILGS